MPDTQNLPARPQPYQVLGLGWTSAQPATAAEALTLSGLDWTVELAPAFAALEVPSGVGADGSLMTEMKPVNAARHRAIVRRDAPDGPEVLGIAGLRYEPLQNRDAFAFLDDLLGERAGATIIGGGALDGGRRTIALVQLPRHLELRGGDRIDHYLLAENRHDGNGSFRIAAHANRLHCTNQIRATFRNANLSWQARHTSGVLARAEEARQALHLVDRYAEALAQAAGTLLELEMSSEDLTGFAERLLAEPERASERQRATVAESRRELLTLARESATTETGRGTAWAAWNAATEWHQHYRGSRLSPERRAERALTTDTDLFATRALALLAPQLAR